MARSRALMVETGSLRGLRPLGLALALSLAGASAGFAQLPALEAPAPAPAVAAPTAPAAARAVCRDDHVELRGPWGQAGFTVELADTDETRALGLMNRRSMPRFSGMFFVFEPPAGPASFWMENTLIPLDMLFLDPAGRVVSIHPNARPLDRTPIYGGDNILYVLEINGGMAERLGIVPGSELRHPRIDPALAAWACPE